MKLTRTATAGAALLLTSLALGACGRARPAPAAAADGTAPVRGDDPALAEMDGATIRRSEVDRRAYGLLARLEQEQYETRKAALDAILSERLLEREATARGTTAEALVKAEVEDKIKPLTAAEVSALYARIASQLGGRSLAEVRADIERHLRDQAGAERRAAFLRELRRKHAVRVSLEPPRVRVSVPASAPALGPSLAPVTIVEYVDYQCPYCRRAHDVVAELLSRHKGKLRFVYRDFPIEGHPRAFAAAQATRCAGEQGRFWEYHKGIFEKPSDLSEQDLRARAAGLGLNPGSFETCLASGRYDAEIRASVDSGTSLGVNSTPTFFINGRRLLGARPLADFQDVIDDELARAGS